MKKLLFITAAIATLASCNKNASLEVVPAAEDTAIGFSAYASTSATKGTVVEASDVNVDGIGVFAFYQPSEDPLWKNGEREPVFFNTKKFAAPNFMYNQKVTKSGDIWTYSPVKYWPNTQNDLLSFFAYAPYDHNKKWEDFGFWSDFPSGTLTTEFSISDNVADQIDYLIACPVLNVTNKFTQSSEENANDISNKISFEFKHVTAQFDIWVSVKQQIRGAENNNYWSDENTKIYIKDIVLNGSPDSFQLFYPMYGSINPGTSFFYYTTSNSSDISITLKPCADARIISDGWAGPKKFLEAGQYLFLAPELSGHETVTITYDVVTKVGEGNNANDSKVTNVITKELPFLRSGMDFGLAYKLIFVIGMDDVDISAEIEEWEDVEEDEDFEPVPVPDNKQV